MSEIVSREEIRAWSVETSALHAKLLVLCQAADTPQVAITALLATATVIRRASGLSSHAAMVALLGAMETLGQEGQ